ncbi:MAG: GyrI-like domain-containing protein [Culicoidibacterales bacterium]
MSKEMIKYEVVDLSELLIAGYGIALDEQTPTIIPSIWEMFLQTWQYVDYAKHTYFYAIQRVNETQDQQEYIVGIETMALSNLPEGMSFFDFPAMKYAQFEVETKELDKFYEQLATELNQDNLTYLDDYFIEMYPSNNLEKVYILLPIELLESE